jgi:F-type H+-transporting ATPase subunit a
MSLLGLLQEHGQKAAEGASGAAQHGAEAAGHAAAHGEHIPWIVGKVNEWIGPQVFELQSKIMPPIYKVFGFMFGDHWPGEGKTYQQYVAEGYLPIPTHVVMFLFVVFIAVVVLTILRGKLSAEAPNTRQQTLEVGVETVKGLLNDLVGPGGMKHFPVVATFGVLILLSNLTSFLPDMVAPTANFNVTLALALSSFLYYNYVGIRENGLIGHLKHFAGPIWWMAWLMFPIEIVSNLARILSLSMRLFGNVYGEEQVSGAISNMVQWIVPAMIMPLGLLTSVLQTFIFIVLSMVYLGEVSHHSEEHGEHGKSHAVSTAH